MNAIQISNTYIAQYRCIFITIKCLILSVTHLKGPDVLTNNPFFKTNVPKKKPFLVCKTYFFSRFKLRSVFHRKKKTSLQANCFYFIPNKEKLIRLKFLKNTNIIKKSRFPIYSCVTPPNMSNDMLD